MVEYGHTLLALMLFPRRTTEKSDETARDNRRGSHDLGHNKYECQVIKKIVHFQ